MPLTASFHSGRILLTTDSKTHTVTLQPTTLASPLTQNILQVSHRNATASHTIHFFHSERFSRPANSQNRVTFNFNEENTCNIQKSVTTEIDASKFVVELLNRKMLRGLSYSE